MKRLKHKNQDRPKSHIREKNQTLILAAAEKVFARQGLSKTTTQMIANEVGLPKTNIHYYYRSKQDLLEAVLDRILSLWLESITRFTLEDGPEVSLTRYINEKMQQSKNNVNASKVFAMALIGEEPFLLDNLKNSFVKELKQESKIIQAWIDQGLMKVSSIEHLFISIWALTQTYADFDAQVKILLNKTTLEDADYNNANDFIVHMILKSCEII